MRLLTSLHVARVRSARLLATSLLTLFGVMPVLAGPAAASNTPNPASVTVAGSLQDELGCPADWSPDCAATHLTFDSDDAVWQGTFSVPTGSYEYKAPLNDNWSENYGLGGQLNGANIPLALGSTTSVKFYYDHETHWITDDVNSVIAVAPGSFQSELGCASDWDPSCLRSWLQDPDGDGTYSFVTNALPAGSYEAKVAIGESWDENYGDGGVSNGANIAFTVPADCIAMVFSYDAVSHVLTIAAAPPAPQPSAVTAAGSFQQELGCPSDWMPDCAVTHLGFDAEDTVWQGTFSLPNGNWEYKAPIDDSWTENYGANATLNGPNIFLNLATPSTVKFYYDHGSHWITDNVNSRIVTAPGSFQSELGCNGDWDPSCLRSWLQDPDGDGVYTLTTRLPAGEFEAKAAINEDWAENYGLGGVPGGANLAFSVPTACSEVFFSFESASNVLTVSAQGAPRGNINRAQGYWVLGDTIAWNQPVLPNNVYRLHWDPAGDLSLDATGVVGGQSIVLTPDPAGLPQSVRDKFPHLASLPAFRIGAADLGLVPEILKSRFAVSATAGDGTPIDATSLQIPGVLDDLYAFDGDLGVVWSGHRPTLRVWAPTARNVDLLLFDDSAPATAPTTIPMVEDPSNGTWSVVGSPSWNRKFYLYQVEVWAPSSAQVVTNQVTDPYSVSLAADSTRSQIVDLDDRDLEPFGWDHTHKPRLDAPEDIVLYELHVRDFSIADTSVPAAERGTFKAFDENNSRGMRHLRSLARAGLTHVHLLPSFDFATVPERREDQATTGDLSGFAPDAEDQQAAIAAIKDQDGFNWGYDPFHYGVPEGGYSTDPDGVTRIREFREMVQSLNRAGLRVVMDVVYNHTTASGQNAKSVLDRIVPGYYQRLNGDGFVETSTCCSNTATEHAMMQKLMVDTLVRWARDYKVDGFRFDLMGHHMKSNILEVQTRLASLTPAHDGVDGSKIYLYGEGWNFGEVANDARGVNATQLNMPGTGIGTFSDRLRDAARGGNPFGGLQEQGFLNGLYVDPNGVPQGDELGKLRLLTDQMMINLAGNLAAFPLVDRNGSLVTGSQIDYNGQPSGYTQDPQEVITYVEAHDNETLFDAINLKAPASSSMATRVRMQNLGASVVGLGQGIPFFHAGTELLRSKSFDRDSFNSGDWFNQIDWTFQDNGFGHGLPTAEKNQSNWPLFQPLLANSALRPSPADIARATNHFEEILRIRKSSRLFRLPTGQDVIDRVQFHNTGPAAIPGLIVMSIADADGAFDRTARQILVAWNANDETQSFTPSGLIASNFSLHRVQRTSSDPIVRTSSFAAGTFTVPGYTTAVFVAKRSEREQIDLLLADLDRLVAAGDLRNGKANSLRNKLEQAQRDLDRNRPSQAADRLEHFVDQVENYVSHGDLPRAAGEDLEQNAENVIDCLKD